jgi:hypothetical protein
MEKKINERLDTMLSEFKGMVDFGIKDIKLVFVEILSLVMAHISSTLMLLGFGLIFLLFISLGGGLLLNDMLDSHYLGFFIIAGIFVLVVLVLILIRKSRGIPFFTNNFIRLFVKILYNDDEKDQ